jgi:hypothetical protein
MLRFLINNPFLLLCAFLLISCDHIEQFINDFDIYDYVNLKPINIKTYPENNSVLPEIFSPVTIKFDTKMEKKATEGVLQVSSDLGIVRGDISWKGNNLYFVPISGWTAGIRYNINLIGTIRSVDGREMRIERYVSFYAISKNNLPSLNFYSPLNGASVGTNDTYLKFYFSHSMDKQTVESALSTEGIVNKKYEWSDDDKTLIVIPDKALAPWNRYQWTLRDTAKNKEGIPLPKTYSGFFMTDLDQTMPQVESVYPVLAADGSWFPTGADIETGIGLGQGIAVKFNKPMGENVLRSMRFEPSLSGRTEFLTEKSIVYIFSRDPEPEINYTLIVSGDTRDSEGLKIGTDFRISFSVDIPYLNIISIIANDSIVIEDSLINNNVIPVIISPATGEISVSFYFSLPFTDFEKQNTPQKISITPFFPRTLSPVAINNINWVSNDRLIIQWEGLTASAIDSEDNVTPHYYKLNIPGGKGGIIPETGIYMKKDINIFLEVIR